MSDGFQLIASLVLGSIFFVSGLLAISRKRVSVGIGGRNTRPLFFITITGTGAVIYGLLLLISGVGIALPLASFILPPAVFSTVSPEYTLDVYIIGPAALALAIIVFIFTAIMQTAIAFGERIREQNEKNLRKRPVDTPPEI